MSSRTSQWPSSCGREGGCSYKHPRQRAPRSQRRRDTRAPWLRQIPHQWDSADRRWMCRPSRTRERREQAGALAGQQSSAGFGTEQREARHMPGGEGRRKPTSDKDPLPVRPLNPGGIHGCVSSCLPILTPNTPQHRPSSGSRRASAFTTDTTLPCMTSGSLPSLIVFLSADFCLALISFPPESLPYQHSWPWLPSPLWGRIRTL